MKLRHIIFTAALLALVSCSNTSSTNTTQTSPIVGKWNWVNSVGGFAGWTLTPKSEGYTCSVSFSDQSDYSIYRNDSLMQSGFYTVATSNGISHVSLPASSEMIFTGRVVFSGKMTISHDSLMISQDSISDGYTSLFIHK